MAEKEMISPSVKKVPGSLPAYYTLICGAALDALKGYCPVMGVGVEAS